MADEVVNRNQNSKKMPDVRFVVEIGDALNSNFIWPLDQRRLRGRWAAANMKGDVRDERFARMPDELPGICIQIDTAKRIARFFDPLANPKNQRIRDNATAACKSLLSENFEPMEEVKFADMSDDDIKSMLHWVRRWADARYCVVREGSLPEMRDIVALPGEISFSNFDQGSDVVRKRPAPLRPYVPVRHVEDEVAPIVYAAN